MRKFDARFNRIRMETFRPRDCSLCAAARVQPDLQVVWNPAFSPDSGPSVVFQVQYILSW